MEPNTPPFGMDRLKMLCQAAGIQEANVKETIKAKIRAQEAGSGLKVGPPPYASQGFRNRENGRSHDSNGCVEHQHTPAVEAAYDSGDDTIVEPDSDNESVDGTISDAESDNDLPKCGNRACRYQGEEIDSNNPSTCPVCSLLHLKCNIDMGGRESKRSSHARLIAEESAMNQAKKDAAASLQILRRSTSGSPNNIKMGSHGHPSSAVNNDIHSGASTESIMSWGPNGRAGQMKTTEDMAHLAEQSSRAPTSNPISNHQTGEIAPTETAHLPRDVAHLSQPGGIVAMSPESMSTIQGSPKKETMVSKEEVLGPDQRITPPESEKSNDIETAQSHHQSKSAHKELPSNFSQQPADIKNISKSPHKELHGNISQQPAHINNDFPAPKPRTSSVKMTSHDVAAKRPKLKLRGDYKDRKITWPKGRAYTDKDVQAEARKQYARKERLPELEDSDNDVVDERNPRFLKRRRARTPVDDYPIALHDNMTIDPHDNEYMGAVSEKYVKYNPQEYINARANNLWNLEIDRLMDRHMEILQRREQREQREQDTEMMMGGASIALGSPGKHRDSGSGAQATRQQKRQRFLQDESMY